MDTGNTQVIVLPLIQTGGILTGDIGDFELMDVCLHADALASFVSIVTTYVEHPVSDRTGKSRIVIVEEVSFQTLVS